MQFSHTIQLYETDPRLVENFFDAIISLDHNLVITYWNYGAELTFGYTHEEATGRYFEHIISPHNFDIKITSITKELDENLEWRGEIIHKRKDESLICCLVSICKLLKKDQVQEYLLISRDVSDRKELENLQQLNDELEEQLTRKSGELTNFFERINDGFFFTDRNWRYTHINKKAAGFFQRDPNLLIGKHLWTEFPGLQSSIFGKLYLKAMETMQYIHVEEYNDALDKWLQVDAYPNDEGLSVFLRDISEEKKAERQIKESEELYRKIVETAQEGIWMISSDHKTTFVNSTMAKMLGYERQEMVGRHFRHFLHDDSKALLSGNAETGENKLLPKTDVSLVTKDGRQKWVIVNSSSLYKDDQHAGTLAMVMDITERKKEQELRESHQQLRDLASRLQNIREEERASLAREIHDELGQQLTALKMDVYWLYKHLPPGGELLKMRADAVMKLVNETLPKIEKKAIELHPSLLHDLGLLAAIEWQNKQFRSRHEAMIDFTARGSDESLSQEVAIALYRIYQEALTNIMRHAKASKITTTFTQNSRSIQLTIADNGLGFEPGKMDKKKTLGLLSMQERCVVIGGKCDITSFPEKGTVISVYVPMSNPNETTDDKNFTGR
jgi:PAS domain S-box-containing protein